MLSTELAGVKLKNPTVLASGILGVTGSSLAAVAKAGAGAVTTKSISLNERKGHPNPVIVTYDQGMINAVGLSNPGAKDAVPELEYAVEIGGREQLAIQAYAQALESIPKTLAENAGMDSIDALVALRNKHKDGKDINYGVNVFKGVISDMEAEGVVEPAKVKTQAISSATETTRLILRIDDIIASRGGKGAGGPPGGPGGMPMGEY